MPKSTPPTNRSGYALASALLTSTALVGVLPAAAAELPRGGAVAYGSVGIATPQPNAMAITQSSPTAIVNWQSFSIGQGARVDIAQPSASSTLLNRVGGSTPSTIAGSLNANGQVYLVNPNGIAITKTGVVNAGAFVASTLAISDEDFKAGRRVFTGNGASAAVSNAGTIEIGRGGYAALIGGKIDNSGTVSVPLGKVGLGAGERATLDLSGDGFLQVEVPSAGTASGDLIRHSGRIAADGGRVEMKAATAREAARQAINLTGLVEARSVGGRSGAIVLGGGAGGAVAVSGRLDASGSAKGAKGGRIAITGRDISLKGATLDASGDAGGGTVRIGGGKKGGEGIERAQTTLVDETTTIRADALGNGNGGDVVVWADGSTTYRGTISARGGAEGGDGGAAEVSGKSLLDYQGFVDMWAPAGRRGTLLLDPSDVAIDATGGDVDGPSPIGVTQLQAALATADVTISTASEGGDLGNITVNVPITWTSASTLTLQADNNIVINGAITATAGSLALNANIAPDANITINANITAAGLTLDAVTITPLGAINVGTFTLQNGTFAQTGPALPAFSAGNFIIGNGIFVRVAGGNGTAATPFLIADVYGLQGIASGNLAASWQLANDIDASGTSGWNAGAGFVPIGGTVIGQNEGGAFSGSLNGAGHAITGLTINRPTFDDVGLFGVTGAGSAISNLVLSGANVTGGTGGEGVTYVGALVGDSSSAISGVTGSGTVISAGNIALVGGLAGINRSTIANSSFAGSVVGTGTAPNVGGLVGTNCDCGTITRSSSSATVVATSPASDPSAPAVPWVGGLAGSNEGAIGQSFATGTVTAFGTALVGGLVGNNTGGEGTPATSSITQSFATGAVTAVGANSAAGGLAGQNAGTIVTAYASGNVSAGGGSAIGGLVGFATPTSSITQTYASGSVGSTGAGSILGGLVGANGGDVAESYAVGAVAGAGAESVGGLVGTNTAVDSVVTSFWDINATGQAAGFGLNLGLFSAIGLTTAQFQDPIFFVALASGQGWNFDTAWSPPSAGFYPELYALSPVVRVVADSGSRLYGGANPVLTGTLFGGPSLFLFGPAGDSLPIGVTLTTAAGATSRVGTYAITGTGTATSLLGVNYRVVTTDGTLTVAPAPLTIFADNLFKPFGIDLVFTGTEFSAFGLVNGEQLTSAVLASLGASSTAFFGIYPIFIGAAQGTDLSNYAVSYVPGVLFVGFNPAILGVATGGSNLVANLPVTTPIGWNPPDDIIIDLGSGGGSGGSGGGGPTLGTGLNTQSRNAAALATLESIEKSSAALEAAVAACEARLDRRELNVQGYTSCVADALERYAGELDRRILELPPPFRGIAATIRQAAARVRVARTVPEARAAVRVAISEVRKAIALLKADEPTVVRIQVRQGTTIASALSSVEGKLAKAEGL